VSNKPTLVTIGSDVQRSLWAPLAETFDLLFVNSQAGAAARGLGVECRLVQDVVTGEVEGSARAAALRLVSEYVHSFEERRPHFVLGHPRLDGDGLTQWYYPLLLDAVTQLTVQTEAILAAVAGKTVAGILLHEDVTHIGRLLAAIGTDILRVPVIHVPHASHFLSPTTADLHSRVYSTHLALPGEYARDWYAAAGVPSTVIRVTGAPQWDELYGDPSPVIPRDAARRTLHCPPEGEVLGYAGTWAQYTTVWGRGQEDVWDAARTVFREAKRRGAYVVVSLHPHESSDHVALYADLLRKSGAAGCITRGTRGFVLGAVDALIVHSSNFGVEALAAGVPVVDYWLCGAQYPVRARVPGTWGDTLGAQLDVVSGSTPGREFVRYVNHDDDGGATTRVVAAVKEWV